MHRVLDEVRLIERGPRRVGVGRVHDQPGDPVAYSASKHAVIGLTRSVARDVAGAGIQVNAVCPGCVESPMMERIERRLGALAGTGPASFVASIPAGRYCDPREVGQLVAWLALDAPDYVNGSLQVIDGAMRA